MLQPVLQAVLCQEDPQVQLDQTLDPNIHNSNQWHESAWLRYVGTMIQKSVCPEGWRDWKVPRSLDPNLRFVLQCAMQIYVHQQGPHDKPTTPLSIQFAVGFYSVATTLPEHFIQNHGMFAVQFHDISESQPSKPPTTPPLRLSWHDLV